MITGNYIADHVKGNGINKFSDAIRNGIFLHRDIDRFTDSHPQFILSKNRLAPNYRKYAGVIVDMYYDQLCTVSNLKGYSNNIKMCFSNENS